MLGITALLALAPELSQLINFCFLPICGSGTARTIRSIAFIISGRLLRCRNRCRTTKNR
jgi:hypothetical protein